MLKDKSCTQKNFLKLELLPNAVGKNSSNQIARNIPRSCSSLIRTRKTKKHEGYEVDRSNERDGGRRKFKSLFSYFRAGFLYPLWKRIMVWCFAIE